MRPSRRHLAPLLIVAALAAACSGREASDSSSSSAVDSTASSSSTNTTSPDASLPDDSAPDGSAPDASIAPPVDAPSPTTPAATEPVESATWAVYREPNTLDPIYAFDYPENTTITTMCESLLLQEPDGTLSPGLATLERPDDLTMVFTLREGVSFWDGTPLTADDVVFSLERQRDPALGGFYGAVFDRVDSIEATSPSEVTITLTEPDYWLQGELSSMPGVVTAKAFTEAAGAEYGTPAGGVMCTGPFVLDSWATGDRIRVVANADYRNGPGLLDALEIVGVPDQATLTSALLSGDIDGTYSPPLDTLSQLQASDALTVTEGPSFAASALITSNPDGVLGTVEGRQALSAAIDRQGIVDTVNGGTGEPARAIANPGSWGYAPEVFAAAWDALPEVTVDVAAGTALAEDAGIVGETLVLATTNEILAIANATNIVADAAKQIGLEVELQTVSAANYINLFIDPAAREGVDGFVTVNYPDFADPAALYASFVLANGSQNYNGYENPDVTALMNEARSTADDAARAELVSEAQEIIMEELPWIGLVVPATVLATSADLTGAPSSFVYMNAPWAATLGGAG
jgi:peptide/nickel transport system substrate-binding protein